MAPVVAESRKTFSIDRILGLELERPGNCLKLHRPWTEIGAEKEKSLNTKQHQHYPQQLSSPRPSSSWYIRRRQRTAFTNSQMKLLETVFQMNSYPGIQLREQLARRLDLDEDRIQIWFQNRRAKLKRSLRESRLRLVQTAVADLRVGQELIGQLAVKQENRFHQLPSHLQHEKEEEEEEEEC